MTSASDARRARQVHRRRRKTATLLVLLVLLAITVGLAGFYLQRLGSAERAFRYGEREGRIPAYVGSSEGGPGLLALKGPLGVAVSPDGKTVYVVDSGNARVVAFDASGNVLFYFRRLKGKQNLVLPVYVAVNSLGKVYVSDRGLKAVLVFEPDGRFVYRFVPDNRPNFVWDPLALAFDGADNLYVSDAGRSQRLLVFRLDGRLLFQIGRRQGRFIGGRHPGQFRFANGVSTDRYGRLYVADSDNGRIQEFNPQGLYLMSFQTGGLPRGISVDSRGRMLVTDSLGQRVLVYTSAGRRTGFFGRSGQGPGEFSYPNSVAIDGFGRIFVTDRANDRLQIWTWKQVVAIPRPRVREIPWAVAVPLFFIIAWIWLRGPRVVAHEDFIGEIAADKAQALVARVFSKVAVTGETYEAFAKTTDDRFMFGHLMRPLDQDDDLAHDLMEQYGLSESEAAALALAVEHLRRPLLLTDSSSLRSAATLLGIATMDSEEFRAAYQTGEDA